jgi:hypothetical protein
LLPEQTTKQILDVATITIPNSITDTERFNHRAGQPLRRIPSGPEVQVATGEIEFAIVNRYRQHHGPSVLPTNVKAGQTVVRGVIRGRYGTEYKAIREDALDLTYANFVQKWITAGGTKFLQLDMPQVDIDASDIEAMDKQIPPFRGEFAAFSDEVADAVTIEKEGF